MNASILCADAVRNDHPGFLNQAPMHTPPLDRLSGESMYLADLWLRSQAFRFGD
jgi:hypothetical protein